MIDLRLGDCLELMKDIPDGSVDAVICDPPYTDGENSKNDLLSGHKIQTSFSIADVTKEFYRILKPNSFYAFFGAMPTIRAWDLAAVNAGFNFRIDIVWCKKRGGMGGNLYMKRSHEMIYVFSKGSPNYYKTKGVWSDVSQALVEYDLCDIESVFRHLSYYKGLSEGKELKGTVSDTINNDDHFRKKGFKKTVSQTLGKKDVKFNSVWAFSTHNLAHRNPETGQVKHPSVKSLPLMERLTELLTDSKETVIDPFMGSGSTGIACINTNRNFIGIELDPNYFATAQTRIATATQAVGVTSSQPELL